MSNCNFCENAFSKLLYHYLYLACDGKDSPCNKCNWFKEKLREVVAKQYFRAEHFLFDMKWQCPRKNENVPTICYIALDKSNYLQQIKRLDFECPSEIPTIWGKYKQKFTVKANGRIALVSCSKDKITIKSSKKTQSSQDFTKGCSFLPLKTRTHGTYRPLPQG